MLTSNYSRNIPLFKGFIVKNFKENPDGSFSAYLEMPKTDHICPHCSHSTSYIKDYRTQIVKDAQIFGQDVFIHLRKRRYLCKHCSHSFTEDNPLVHRYQHFTSRFYLLAYKEFGRYSHLKLYLKDLVFLLPALSVGSTKLIIHCLSFLSALVLMSSKVMLITRSSSVI